MNMRTTLPLVIFLLLPISQSNAEQAYTWVDESGTTHFSETPPYDETISADEINLLPAPSAGKIVDDDFYSVANQADRMQKKRLENEKLIAERLKTEAEEKEATAKSLAAQQADNMQNDTQYYPTYPHYGHRPSYPGKPPGGKPVRPEHLPAERPRSSLGVSK